MSKKDKNVVTEQNTVESTSKKTDKVEKNTKKQPKKTEKKAGLGKKIKESASELKKVSWPTFGKTVKQTGVVILVVVLCTLVLFGFDQLFSLLYKVLT